MSVPRTEAGRRLLEDLPLVLGSEVEQHGRAFAERITEAVERAVLAIEAEARAQGALHENLIAEGELERVERLEAALDVEALADAVFYVYGNVTRHGASIGPDRPGPREGHRKRSFWVEDARLIAAKYRALLGSPQERSGE
jgi:hypothetical protein